MRDDDMLPRELVWDGAHVSELGLTAIADGQDAIVQPDALAHVDRCEWCAGRLGRAALLSSAVGDAVAGARQVSKVTERAAPRPWIALAAGVVVAFAAGLPMLAQLGHYVTFALGLWTRGVPVLARSGLALAASSAVSRALPVATLAASALLVAMGFAIARARSRSSSEEQGSLS